MSGNNTLVHFEQGGATLAVESGGSIDFKTGAVKKSNGVPDLASATFTPAAGSTNVCLVSIQLTDAAAAAVAASKTMHIWLSDAATGIGLTATTASGAVAVGASGTDLAIVTSKKLLISQTTVAGLYILSITDSAKTGFYVAILIGGQTFVSSQLITANYG